MAQVKEASLTFVGDGPLMAELQARSRALAGRVEILGRREGNGMAEAYRQADVLVMPAVQEVWGLVVNEAISNGLYVIATDQVGSAHDLVGADTGVIVKTDDRDSLVKAMPKAARMAVRDSETRALRAAKMRERTPARFARDIMKAVEIAIEGRTSAERPAERAA